jgi:hypothetical protein
LRASLQGSIDRGLSALIATAQNVASARALVGVGFRVIDAPIKTALHDRFLMANVGAVLEDRDARGFRAHTGTARALARYFNRRQQEILGNISLDGLLTGWAKGSEAPADEHAREDATLAQGRFCA